MPLRDNEEYTHDEQRVNREGSFHGTTGVVFAFDSAISLDTVVEHAKALNERFDSDLWPEIIPVLDKGFITYAIQYPGSPTFLGSLMSVA